MEKFKDRYVLGEGKSFCWDDEDSEGELGGQVSSLHAEGMSIRQQACIAAMKCSSDFVLEEMKDKGANLDTKDVAKIIAGRAIIIADALLAEEERTR